MRLFSPWALWFLSLMPLVILMYILKQKFEERQVSSIYLWEQVLKDIEVNTPWQRLKKNLLLMLQLLSILFFVFALADPYLYTGGGMYSNLIVVIDNTGSMNARYEGKTRLEHAKELAEEMINSAGAKANITLLTVERSPKVEIGKASDKGEAVSKLRGIEPSNSYGNINDSVSLVKAMVKQYEGNEGYKAVFYTDSPVNTGDLNAQVVSLASELTNVSMDYISYSAEEGRLTVLVRMTNRSGAALDREISLFGGEQVLDIINVSLEAGETRTVYFEDIPADVPYLWAELTEKDDLDADNRVYCVVKAAKPARVLLVSESNVFVEKALSNISGLELYKTNPGEDIDQGYDLYIFDAETPAELPESGAVLLINPSAANGIVGVGAELQGGKAEVRQHPVTKYMENADFTVAKLKDTEVPHWADVLISVNGNAAALYGEYQGRKTAVISFDLHDSDFALTTEYPIFMYNLAVQLTGIDTEGSAAFVCGDSIDINPDPEAEEAAVKDPEGNVHRLELAYPMLPFEKTGLTGIYELLQKTAPGADKADKISGFAVNFPVEFESASLPAVEGQNAEAAPAAAGNSAAGTALQDWFLGLLLLAAAIEWVVYTRGY